MIGGGITLNLPLVSALSASASASALYADFDLSRRDAYFNLSNQDTEIREVSLDTQEIVPVIVTHGIKARVGMKFGTTG